MRSYLISTGWDGWILVLPLLLAFHSSPLVEGVGVAYPLPFFFIIA